MSATSTFTGAEKILKKAQRPMGDHEVMVPDVAFENFVSGTAADVAAHGGWLQSCGYDLKSCRILEHLYPPGTGRGVPLAAAGWRCAGGMDTQGGRGGQGLEHRSKGG
jgi:hypothetical protein